MAKAMLPNQFMGIPGTRGGHFRVVVGSGMGLKASGDTSDGCFLQMTEKQSLLGQGYRNSFNLKFYGRFKEDLLFIFRG